MKIHNCLTITHTVKLFLFGVREKFRYVRESIVVPNISRKYSLLLFFCTAFTFGRHIPVYLRFTMIFFKYMFIIHFNVYPQDSIVEMTSQSVFIYCNHFKRFIYMKYFQQLFQYFCIQAHVVDIQMVHLLITLEE